MIWNVGYGGLGKEVDFFYDGGKMVITPKELVDKFVYGIYSQIEKEKNVDFMLLQEVDVNSKRSHGINMMEGVRSVASSHFSSFATNYKVQFLPFPWTTPLGKIHSGLLTLSSIEPTEIKRIAFPGITDFPRKLFYLERCMMLSRFALQNGKELVVINTHLEAYDDGGVKKQQMEVMKKYVEAEYANGNYVVIGGDWNIAPPDFDVKKWEKEHENDALYLMKNDPNYIKNWQYVYDGNTPTNRKNIRPLDAKTFTTVIDYYMVSPNLEVVSVVGVNAGFEFSDHNPVKATLRLR
jgi:endonuclease/exonuclease/phosphatase family metal-dependent hydrolase